jgi:hypothetical protein
VATNKDFIVKNGLSVGEDISVSGSVTSNLQFDNSVQAQFGTASGLKIYHDGSHGRLQNTVGNFNIQANDFHLTDSGNVAVSFLVNHDGETSIRYSQSPKLVTTNTGVDITGNAVLTGELRGPSSFVIDPSGIGNNTGEVIIKGDLTVDGTTTTVNSTTLDVADKNITLNHGSGNTTATAGGAGITIQDAVSSGNDASILWDASNDKFDFSHNVSVENSSGAMIKVDDTNGRFIKIRSANSGSQNANISSYAGLHLGGADNASHMLIANNGDTSFYDSASSSAVKMLWDASAESLSIGDVGSSTDRRLNVSGTGPQTTTTQYGVVVNPTMSDDVTGSIYNIYSQANVASGATLTNLYSVYIGATSLNGSSVTNNYGLYQAGSEKNYFAGWTGGNNTRF